MGFMTSFANGALTGIINEQNRSRDERAEATRMAMERLDRIVTQREAQVEQRMQWRQQAEMVAQANPGMSVQDAYAAIEAKPENFDRMMSGQLRPRGATPAATSGIAGPNPNARPAAPTTTAATGGTAGALGQLHREESGGRMTPGIMGDGNRSFGPLQVQAGALTDVNRRHGTNYTPEQLAADPSLGKQVGEQYYGLQLERFGGDHRLAAAAYNGGPSRLSRVGLAGMAPATQRYADRVASAAGPADARTDAASAQGPEGRTPDLIVHPMGERRDTSGLPPLPDTTSRPTDTRPPAPLGETARGAMDFLFARSDPSRANTDARRRYAGMRGMSVEQLAQLERPLPRASFSGQGGFEMAPETPGEIAKAEREQRDKLAVVDRQNDGRVRSAEASLAAREARDARRPPTPTAYRSAADAVTTMLGSSRDSPFNIVRNPTTGALDLEPKVIGNSDANQRWLQDNARLQARAQELLRDNPGLGGNEAALLALREPGAPWHGTDTGLTSPPPQSPSAAPARPARTEGAAPSRPARTEGAAPTPVRTRADVEALPPGTRYITPDGKIARRAGTPN